MAGLLISVKDAEEAVLVSRFPISILDVKDPSAGALGAADATTLEAIVIAAGDQIPLSFSAGELADWISPTQSLELRFPVELLKQFDFVKIGLAGMLDQPDAGREHSDSCWKDHWRRLFSELPDSTRPVAVAYLDCDHSRSPSPREVIEFAAAESSCSTILFDTFSKTHDLFAYVNKFELRKLIETARSAELAVVVAGSITQNRLGDAMAGSPEFVGVRGAVCLRNRDSNVDEKLVSEFIDELQALNDKKCEFDSD